MKVYQAFKLDNDEFDMAVFAEHEFTEERKKFYEDNGYTIGHYDSVGEWIGNLADTTASDGECIDMLVELCDKGFVEGSIRNENL